MPNPLQGSDIVGHTLRASELGLASTGIILATASPKDFTAYKTMCPETVICLVRLSSGNATFNMDVTADGVYASATVTTGAVSDTAYHAMVLDTSTTDTYINVRATTSANAVVDRFLVLPLGKLTTGEDAYNVRYGLLAVMGSNPGDGGGTFTFTAAD